MRCRCMPLVLFEACGAAQSKHSFSTGALDALLALHAILVCLYLRIHRVCVCALHVCRGAEYTFGNRIVFTLDVCED